MTVSISGTIQIGLKSRDNPKSTHNFQNYFYTKRIKRAPVDPE